MISADNLEGKIAELLDDFYRRRLSAINSLKLEKTLARKNPYLFRATGVRQASEIINELLAAYMSSSDEGIFGDAFFEPLAQYVSGGTVSPSEGVDVAIVTDDTYTAIAVKSGPAVFNSQSRKRQITDFNSLRQRLNKTRKLFEPLVGYGYGRKRKHGENFRELAGQAFWNEITGEDDFYIRVIRSMKEKPQQHAPAYKAAFDAAVNRFTRDFIEEFCNEDGTINWDKLIIFNSGEEKPKGKRKGKANDAPKSAKVTRKTTNG